MGNKLIKIISPIALITILALQGIWLYNTYLYYETDVCQKLDDIFPKSVEKGVHDCRRASKDLRPSGASVNIQPDDDVKDVIKAFNMSLLEAFDIHLNLSDVDHIFDSITVAKIGKLDYTLCKVDSMGNFLEVINHNYKYTGTESDFLYTDMISMNDSEFLMVIVAPPEKVIFGRMTYLLILSGIMIIIITYCFAWQIQVILRQNRIASLRQDFTYSLIHDMKTPITTISMGIRALQSGKLDDKPQTKDQYFNVINKESNHLLLLTDRILTIAKLEENKLKLDRSNIDLPKLINDIVKKFEIDSIKHVTFETKYNVGQLYADQEFLREAIVNLIDNSIKYSGNSVKISIRCDEENDFVRISVRDNGWGIPLTDQKRIFEKFERGTFDNRRKESTGFGLGLNYVYRVVKAHGGNVEVNSVEGVYSEFVINIPYR